MKPTILIITILLFSFSAFGQEKDPLKELEKLKKERGFEQKASINKWRGLIIGESSFEQAKEILGEPVKDKPNETFRPIFYSKWFGNKLPKGFREVKFKNIEGFDNIVLFFKENKLLIIEMDMKKDLSASALTDAYDTRFYPLLGNFAAGITPNDLSRTDREMIYPERFPPAYFLASANDKTIGFAQATMGFGESFGAILTTPRGQQPGLTGTMPGLVRKMQLISRTLEIKTGTNLLK